MSSGSSLGKMPTDKADSRQFDMLGGLRDLVSGSPMLGVPNEGPAVIALIRMIRLARRMRGAQEELAGQVGLHVGDLEILFLLQRMAHGRVIRVTDLARVLSVTPSGISKRVDRLESAKFVRREGLAADRRALCIVPTDAGLRVATKARSLSRNDAFAALSAEEWELFDLHLRKLWDAMVKDRGGGGCHSSGSGFPLKRG